MTEAQLQAEARPYLDDGDVVLHLGDCVEVMAAMEPESVDAVVCDPPYGLEFMGKEWDRLDAGLPQENVWKGRRGKGGSAAGGGDGGHPGRRERVEVSFGGKRGAFKRCTVCGKRQFSGTPCTCDDPGWTLEYPAGAPSGMVRMQRWHQTWATEALRVLKPGGHLLAFGGTRTFHRLTCAIEDAGFEVRDCLSWLYGSGFPKSLDVSKAIDKAAGAEREVVGPNPWGANRKPNAQMPGDSAALISTHDGSGALGPHPGVTAPATPEAAAWQGWGTALKPAWEPIVVARKPLAGTVAGNVLAHGTGALNVDGCRVGTEEDRSRPPRTPNAIYGNGNGTDLTASESHPAGRWPANVVLSHTPECREVGTRKVKGSAPASGPTLNATRSVAHGSYDGERGEVPCYADPDGTETVAAWECHPECPVRRLDEEVGELHGAGAARDAIRAASPTGMFGLSGDGQRIGDTGGPSRFFYTAKASSAERDGATHPTVKPLALMRWLVRLVTPPGGVVLDPFAGSGTTGLACREEGFRCVLIEREEEYAAMAAHRLRQLSLFGGVS